MKDDIIAGNLSCEKSRVVWYFIKHDGIVNCYVTTKGNSLFASNSLTLQFTDKATHHKIKLYVLSREWF